jgi:hypothetical protein
MEVSCEHSKRNVHEAQWVTFAMKVAEMIQVDPCVVFKTAVAAVCNCAVLLHMNTAIFVQWLAPLQGFFVVHGGWLSLG